MTSDDATYFWLGTDAMMTSPSLATAFLTDPGLHAPRTVSTSSFLNAGLHPFTIYYGENTGNNRMVLEYESTDAGIPRRLIPTTNYCSCQQDYILALRLLDFQASWLAPHLAQLDWHLERLSGQSPALIQRAGEDLNWTTLHSFVPQANETKGHFWDRQPLKGWNYYRLLYTNANGQLESSPIRTLEDGDKEVQPAIYPNPSQQDEIFLTGFAEEEQVQLRLYSLNGQLLQEAELGMLRNWKFNTLAPGLYLVQLQTATGIHSLKWQRQ
jgi:hypothetical protein